LELQVPGFFRRIEKSGDDRSYAILSAIIVEYHVERMLRLVMPRFDELAKKHEVSFSLKLDLLRWSYPSVLQMGSGC
jgi:hypothetical protein